MARNTEQVLASFHSGIESLGFSRIGVSVRFMCRNRARSYTGVQNDTLQNMVTQFPTGLAIVENHTGGTFPHETVC